MTATSADAIALIEVSAHFHLRPEHGVRLGGRQRIRDDDPIPLVQQSARQRDALTLLQDRRVELVGETQHGDARSSRGRRPAPRPTAAAPGGR